MCTPYFACLVTTNRNVDMSDKGQSII